MCGIIGFTGLKQAAPILLEGLSRMEYRGYDSAGMAVTSPEGLLQLARVSGKVAGLYDRTENGAAFPGACGIAHTRWATHGAPTEANAHPQVSMHGRFAVAHNGIIENFAALKKELIEKGYAFTSQTDTEIVANLLEDSYRGDFQEAVEKMLARIEGSYAFAILCADHPGELFAVRMNSPLILGLGEGFNLFASDVTALVSHTRRVVYMDDGDYARVTPDEVALFAKDGSPKALRETRVNISLAEAEKGGFEHFMMKEIFEQPEALEKTIASRIRGGEIVLDDFRLESESLKNIQKIVITACGSAYYAGLAGRYAIEKLCRIPVDVKLASELRYEDPLIDGRTMLIVLSQSGETLDTIAAMKECKARGAKVLAIVNVAASTIARLADHVLYTWAGPEIAVATTKGYTTQLAVLDLFAVYAARQLGRLDEEEYAAWMQKIRELPGLVRKALALEPAMADLAVLLKDAEHVFFLGRNTDSALAMEGALKLKEISYIHAEAYAAGELKHGTIALLEEGTPVIALCCNQALLEKTASNIIEVKARGAKTIAVAPEGAAQEVLASCADRCVFVPAADDIFSAMIAVVPLQLLAYHTAKLRGCSIDKPKNLAKSVTVE
ncbi:MAG: glutamine--fructose-6-phosphate transaminase (isomerizing) [Clostridia bacterium]|nr:glutamine--fructose-6-phosphate transaminase (isomerizing) [Clostridia bacterium]